MQQDYEQIDVLRALRSEIIVYLAREHDTKKILTFLQKCVLYKIEETQKTVVLGIPNEFILQQVKKFFHKSLLHAIHELYNNAFSLTYAVMPELQYGKHKLQINIKTLLNIPTKTPNKKKITRLETVDQSTAQTMQEYFGILFESKYTLENFIPGSNSELAYSASQAIAEHPGEVYNPFFIYGNVGLGKTHLMQAIGNKIIQKYPEKTVLYLPTTKFIDHIIKAIRFNKLNTLMEKLEHIDVLMLDDIQFLAGKTKTQEIFHNIFNDFYAKHKQIVITSDQAPKDLTLLEARLQSRFALGLVADIKTPDIETRIAILETKCQKKGEDLDHEHIQLLAQIVDTNVRELEGALNIVLMKQKLLHGKISKKDILESLSTLGFTVHTLDPSLGEQKTQPKTVYHQERRNTSIQKTNKHKSQLSDFSSVLTNIAHYYGISTQDIIGSSRKKEVSFARQMAMYIAKKQYHWTLQKIGEYFGGKNHASVIYAIKTFEKHITQHPETKHIIYDIQHKIRSHIVK